MKLIILIAHFNNLEGLERSLLSINEPFNVDVLVVDDGSQTKPDIDRLHTIYKNGKIFLELLPTNQGVGVATNFGLKLIVEKKYELTGRLDCGDRVYPYKFAKQINYLIENKEIKLLGTWVNMVDVNGGSLFILRHPVKYPKIRKQIFLNSTFVNSSTIYYTEILDKIGLFPEKYKRNGEDYAFFFNVVEKFPCENLAEVLLDYEMNPNSLSSKGRKEQIKARISIIKEHFYWGIYPVYGLIRSYILMYLSRDLITFLKKAVLFKKEKRKTL